MGSLLGHAALCTRVGEWKCITPLEQFLTRPFTCLRTTIWYDACTFREFQSHCDPHPSLAVMMQCC